MQNIKQKPVETQEEIKLENENGSNNNNENSGGNHEL